MKKLILMVVTISLIPLGNATAEKARPLGELLEDLGSADWQIQRDAAVELGEQGPDNLGAVIPLLKSKNARARCGACEAIASIVRRVPSRSKEDAETKQATVRPAIGPMIDILKSDPDNWTRTVAAETLAGLSSQAYAAAGDDLKSVVVKILLDNGEDVWVRRNVYKIGSSQKLVAQRAGKYRCLFSVPTKNREEAPVLAGERTHASTSSH